YVRRADPRSLSALFIGAVYSAAWRAHEISRSVVSADLDLPGRNPALRQDRRYAARRRQDDRPLGRYEGQRRRRGRVDRRHGALQVGRRVVRVPPPRGHACGGGCRSWRRAERDVQVARRGRAKESGMRRRTMVPLLATSVVLAASLAYSQQLIPKAAQT